MPKIGIARNEHYQKRRKKTRAIDYGRDRIKLRFVHRLEKISKEVRAVVKEKIDCRHQNDERAIAIEHS